MIPVDCNQTISSVGDFKSIGKVTTTAKNIPFLINAVTDRIYKDKPLAIIREYSTNAWDAHVQAKLPISDIIITLPTLESPELKIRDFGMGLTMEQIRDIYCILGESTKRNSNDLNGFLGLGCKSGFAYGDSFIVTSWIDGKKSTYNIIKGDFEKEGDVIQMCVEDMEDGDKTGIEIKIPIKISDLYIIHNKAADFFKYWLILPTIENMNESEFSRMMSWRGTVPFLSENNWEIRPKQSSYYSPQSVAVMGQIAYPIDWALLSSRFPSTSKFRNLLNILQSNEVILRFPIGSLNFTINREELEYTDLTYDNLENCLLSIFESFEDTIKEKIANAETIWEAKRIYLSLFGKNIGHTDDDDNSNDVENSIKVLSGDLYKLEEIFKGNLFWNEIPINSSGFFDMQMWDISNPNCLLEKSKDPNVPCLITYKKLKSRIKKLRCKSDSNNSIIPYNDIRVIIVDGRNNTMGQFAARYFLNKENERVRKVHVLRFANEEQKNKFFEYYHFDTADFINLSSIVDEIKEWQKHNRKTSEKYGESVTKLKYIDVKNGKIMESDVRLRDLEDGGVFVKCYHNNTFFSKYQLDIDKVSEYLQILHPHFSECLDRVYCLPESKTSAKWFKESLESGLWMNLEDFLEDNVEVVISDETIKEYHYHSFINDNYGNVITKSWLNAIYCELNVESTEIKQLLDESFDGYSSSNSEKINYLNNSLKNFGLPTVQIRESSVNYRGMLKQILDKYPLLRYLKLNSDFVDTEKKIDIVKYIEMIESQRNVLTEVLETV